jgi:hypothetical protein
MTSSDTILPPHSHVANTRQRRQTYTFLTLISVVLLIGVAALGNWLQWWTIGGSAQASSVACPVQTVTSPELTIVSVYNGTERRGLAAAVAKELQARRFRVATVASEAQPKPLRQIALIRYGPDGARAARTVALQFPGKVKMVKDARGTRDVDLVLGEKYKGLLGRKQAGAASAPKPEPVGCIPAAATTATGTATAPAPSAG